VTLHIITGGLQTTVQDLGRVGRQRTGIPVCGAMDRFAHRVANMLVGNDDSAATLEASLLGPAIAFDEPAVIALAGGDLSATINGNAVAPWHSMAVPQGATLRFGEARVGCRTYIAVAGGLDLTPVFGSRSTYLRAQFGGVEGRSLRSGDILNAGAPSPTAQKIVSSLLASGSTAVGRWSVATSIRPAYNDDPIVRVIPGAHHELLDDASRERLISSTFRVSSNSDRMGYRLGGVGLALREPTELLSEAVAFGTIQLPPGGEPIVLMADHQTTGGYPRIGEVASVDLPLIAQLKPGDRLRFRLVSVEKAQQAYLAQERDLAMARAAIELRHSRGTA
jgi:antagonist of KipI